MNRAPFPIPSVVAASALLLSTPAASLALDWTNLAPIGPVSSHTRTARTLELRTADNSTVTLSILAPDLVRVRTLFPGQPASPDHSWAIAKTDWPSTTWQLSESPTALSITTAELEIVINRDPLLITFLDAKTKQPLNRDERPMARDPKTARVAAAKKLGFDEHFYGLGEKAARLDKRRGRFTMWNSDTPGYVEGTDPIYQSIPFYIGWENNACYGLFYDNSHRSTFDMGWSGQDYTGFTAEGGELDYYFFGGPSMKKIISRYTELTGRMPMPPLWALGHQQSRYSYYPDTMVERVAAEYRQRDLPLDVLYLDIHYMDAYRVFTWDKTRFPDPAAFTARLDKQGIKVVTIVDPGVKYEPADPAKPNAPRYAVYEEGIAKDYFLRRKDGSLYIGEVWPGKSLFVDYTKADARAWWGDWHRSLTDVGIAGIWTDMNEPSDFIDKSGATQMDVVFDDLGTRTLYGKHRNLFALNMARATYEGLQKLKPDRRPFVITRAGYAGVQRYAVVWTGDNNVTMDSVALNIPMFASLGLSGQAFVGADVPGFIGRGDAEILARSYQLASLVPLCRNHGTIDYYDHEPWRYGSYAEGIVRKFLKLRYRLMPYIYTTLEEAHRTGVPYFRPLLLEFQTDTNALNLDDQFMIGDALLAAPVVRAIERGREVYFPAGLWYDFWTHTPINGAQTLRVDAPLDHMPLYVRGGSILPTTVEMNHTGEKPWSPLRFAIYPDAEGRATGTLYEDDGLTPAHLKGIFRRISLTYDNNVLTISAPVGGALRPDQIYQPTAPRDFEFTVHAHGKTLSHRRRDDGQAHRIEIK